MNIKKIMLGAASQKKDHGIQIVILDRGWVYVGRCFTDDRWLIIEGAKNIRHWGTQYGLGELAQGPLQDTVLDEYGTIRAPLSALQFFVAVEEEKWT